MSLVSPITTMKSMLAKGSRHDNMVFSFTAQWEACDRLYDEQSAKL